MKYRIHLLELHKTIMAGENGAAPDGTEEVREYRSRVRINDLEPAADDHLSVEYSESRIEPGLYLFTQHEFTLHEQSERELFRSASEELWLESLWREARFIDDSVYVRLLSEDGRRVYQVLRPIARQE